MKTNVRQIKSFAAAFICQSFVPARQTFLAVFHVFTAQDFVQSITQRNFTRHELPILNHHHRERTFGRDVIRILLLLFEAPLQTCREEIRRVRADFATKQIERVAEPEIDVLLNDSERDAADFAHVFIFFHQLRGAFDDAT